MGLPGNVSDKFRDMNLTEIRAITLRCSCHLQAKTFCGEFFDWVKLNFNDPCGGKWVIAAAMD